MQTTEGAITPPWTVLSPAEKEGRLGVELGPLARKNYVATETNKLHKSWEKKG